MAPLALGTYVDAVDALRERPAPAEREVAARLRLLADVLGATSAASARQQATRLRDHAQQLDVARSPEEQGALAIDALQAALTALAALFPDDAAPVPRAHYTAATRAARRIEQGVSIEAQYGQVTEALAAVGRTIRALYPVDPPRASPLDSEDRTVARFRERAAAASRAVSSAARTGWSASQQATAAALRAIGDTIDAAPRSAASSQAIDESVRVIEFEAERLRITRQASFERAGWAKSALSRAVDALVVLAREHPDQPTEILLTHARRAVESIDGSGAFSFQRLAIQDAMRTVVDACRMLAELS